MNRPDEPDDNPDDDGDTGDAGDAGDAAQVADSTETSSGDGTRRPARGGDGGGGRRGAGSGAGGRRHGDSHALGAEVRALRRELEATRQILNETTGHVAEALPRIKDCEDRDAAFAARIDHLDGRTTSDPGRARSGNTDAGDPVDASDAGEEEAPPATPSMGWSEMDRATATAAWEALARFVGEVLHGQYRLTRLQVPDCWPLHPRMVRELAWLRSSYLEAADAEPDVPASSTPWHIRSLPAFFINTADAVDPRECRPGIHRLTEPEVDEHLGACNAARDAGRPAPEPSTETGPDRPRLRTEHFPTRSTAPRSRHDAQGAAPAPTTRTLPDLLVGSCHPDFWLDYYQDASRADLERRPD